MRTKIMQSQWDQILKTLLYIKKSPCSREDDQKNTQRLISIKLSVSWLLENVFSEEIEQLLIENPDFFA